MKNIFVLLLFMLTSILRAQESKYCVITYSQHGKTQEKVIEYLWLIPMDELVSSSQRKIPIYPFIVADDTILEDYKEPLIHRFYYLDIRHFPKFKGDHPSVSYVRKHRKLLETIKCKYSKENHRRKVEVYITPICGKVEERYLEEYNRKVFFSNDFEIWAGFYKEKESYDRIRHLPFEQIPYATDERYLEL